MASLTERYEERIAGVLSCYDRVVVTGTLPGACYAEGMTRFLYANKIRIFDYPQFAATLRDRVRERAAALAQEASITIEHIAKSHIRKEAVVAKVLEERGDHAGLVHVICKNWYLTLRTLSDQRAHRGTPMIARYAHSPSRPASSTHRFAALGLDRSAQPSKQADRAIDANL